METQKPEAPGTPAKDPLADEPVPTYEEYLETCAKEIREIPSILLFKAVVEYVRYLSTREAMMVNLLVEKEVIAPEEVETFFGVEAHKTLQGVAMKSLRKALLGAAASGRIMSPEGKQVSPDDILVILDDILDLGDKGWSGKTIETMSEFFGREETLRETYAKEVEMVKSRNALRAIRRRQVEESAQSDLEARRDRIRRLRIYLSQCNIADKAPPTEEDTQKMLDGVLPIPESP